MLVRVCLDVCKVTTLWAWGADRFRAWCAAVTNGDNFALVCGQAEICDAAAAKHRQLICRSSKKLQCECQALFCIVIMLELHLCVWAGCGVHRACGTIRLGPAAVFL